MKCEKWQILRPVTMDYNHGHVSKLAPSTPADWPASIPYIQSQDAKPAQAWSLGSVISEETARVYDERKTEKYRQWKAAYPAGMDLSLGHVSKLARPETKSVFESMDRIIREEEASHPDDNYVWMKKAA